MTLTTGTTPRVVNELARNAELNELYDDEVGLKVGASTSERT